MKLGFLKTLRRAAACGAVLFAFGIQAAPAQDIVIGAHVPLTGPNADPAARLQKAYEMLVAEVNAKGGIKGRKLKLVIEDDRNDPTTVRAAIDRLATRDKVVGILGTYGSANGIAGAQQAERYGIPNIQPFTSNPQITSSGYKAVFNMTAGDDERWARLLGYLLDASKGKKIAGISIEGIHTASFSALDQYAKEKGVTIVAQEVLGPKQMDTNALITRIKDAKPDILVYNATTAQSIQIHRSLKQLGADIPWVARSPSFGLDSDLVKALESDLNYVVGLDEWYPGAATAGNKEFVANFRKQFGNEPTRIEAKGYAAAQLLVQAIEKASEVTPAAVRDAIAKGGAKTILGAVNFRDNGQRDPVNLVSQIQDMKLVILSPAEEKTGEPKPAPAWSKR